jgi:hypothetical protein
MSNLKKWRQLGQGAFTKWTDEGQKIAGLWLGKHDGQYGPLGSVQTSEGKVTFPLHTALLDLIELPEGAEVRITYLGPKLSKAGKTFKAFTLEALLGDDDAPTRTDDERRDGPESGDVPF